MSTRFRVLLPSFLIATTSFLVVPSMGVCQSGGVSNEETPSRMSDPDQWPPSGSVIVAPQPRSSVNPLGLPPGSSDGPTYFTLQKPDLFDWPQRACQPQRAKLKIPQGWVGFYNSTAQAAAFALNVDGEKRPNVRLGPEEYVTISCGRCDDDAWAAIATEAASSQPFKAKLVSQSLLMLVIDAGQWKLAPSSLASMSISVPEPSGPVPTGIYVGAR